MAPVVEVLGDFEEGEEAKDRLNLITETKIQVIKMIIKMIKAKAITNRRMDIPVVAEVVEQEDLEAIDQDT